MPDNQMFPENWLVFPSHFLFDSDVIEPNQARVAPYSNLNSIVIGVARIRLKVD